LISVYQTKWLYVREVLLMFVKVIQYLS